MGDSSQEVIPQQEVESVKRSEMCIGLNCEMMTLPKNTVTGITIMIAQPVTNSILTQLVTNIPRQHKVKPLLSCKYIEVSSIINSCRL